MNDQELSIEALEELFEIGDDVTKPVYRDYGWDPPEK